MSEFNSELREANRTMPSVVWTILWWGIPILTVLLVLGWGLQAAGIVSMNIRREVVQQSQQYSETKVSLLHKYHNDWLQLEAEIAQFGDNPQLVQAKRAQQANLVMTMREEAARIPKSEVPEAIGTFLERRQP